LRRTYKLRRSLPSSPRAWTASRRENFVKGVLQASFSLRQDWSLALLKAVPENGVCKYAEKNNIHDFCLAFVPNFQSHLEIPDVAFRFSENLPVDPQRSNMLKQMSLNIPILVSDAFVVDCKKDYERCQTPEISLKAWSSLYPHRFGTGNFPISALIRRRQ
jgi:hypothetical protein